jgi:UDP-glucose-4-epimerase GalE
MIDQNPNKTVLVAGGAGYIGSHTAKALIHKNISPVVLDNFCTGSRAHVRFGPVYEGSIADSALVARIAKEHQIETAILFAGHAYVGESVQQPRKYFHNNVAEAVRFLDTLIDLGVNSVVFSSSCSIYGNRSSARLSEDAPSDPLSPYAETKLFLEKVLRWYDSAYGLKYICLRYFNAAGADPEGQLGEDHNPETHLIPLAILAALGGKPLRIFGTDFPTPDGTAIRDYIHVSDLASAHVKAVQYLAARRCSQVVNLGTGEGHSVRQVIAAIERESGRTVPFENCPRREGDAPSLIADPTRARQLLGWTPNLSSLDTIVKTALRWHRQGP